MGGLRSTENRGKIKALALQPGYRARIHSIAKGDYGLCVGWKPHAALSRPFCWDLARTEFKVPVVTGK